jgi:peptidoglycan-associated lipoprotein
MRKAFLMPSLLATLMVLSACSSTPQKTESSSTATRAPAATAPATPATSQPVQAAAYDPLQDPNHALAKRSVFFDFDDFQVKEEFKPAIAAHADYLSKNRGRQIVIEGHADERGSSEYNLALGQKRAEAVRRSLELSGASDKQIETVSFGEEKPRSQNNNEAAWVQNRRADIVYK